MSEDAYLARLEAIIRDTRKEYDRAWQANDHDSINHWVTVLRCYTWARDTYIELRDKARAGEEGA